MSILEVFLVGSAVPYVTKFLQSVIFTNFTNRKNLQNFVSRKFIRLKYAGIIII